ncbi:hypothetical protein DPMN_045966 [Dreissena polymorpha]|uniref:Uncharacterized protein n=1 Tax=Dreissena polymorpha TaxID=45954 RepID=A0A9D4I1U9_DREPO|nr:hypothetical protein DPMN_045966 [Dreissena polymorpha]
MREYFFMMVHLSMIALESDIEWNTIVNTTVINTTCSMQMHVRKMSSKISRCSQHRLISDDTFRIDWIFFHMNPPLNENTIQAESV